MKSHGAAAKLKMLPLKGAFFVTRPPTHTKDDKMELIYNNFDGLDVSFQGALPEEILNKLKETKQQAQSEKRDIPLEIGNDRRLVMVSETGAKGGYAYRFNTGPIGETWFIAHSTDSRFWNIRVSISSLKLALSGYEAVRSGLLTALQALNAFGPSRLDSALGEIINLPIESISRFDFCYDFIMPSGFEPLTSRFIAHHRTKRSENLKKKYIEAEIDYKGDKIESVRLGKMPGRQVNIYNKTQEIAVKNKFYWWDIWSLKQQTFKDSLKQIWRIEVRAGKNELNKWGLKTFKDFEEKVGDVILKTLGAIRYTDPLENDLNRSRWPNHPLWDKCLEASLGNALGEYISNAPRENILKGFRDNHIEDARKRVIGNLIPLGALLGDTPEIIPSICDSLRYDLKGLSGNA